MNDYLVELYVAKSNEHDVAVGTHRARSAAEALTAEGSVVNWVGSIFLPDDETWLLLFQADSLESVRKAAARAELLFDRITEAKMNTLGRVFSQMRAKVVP